MVYRLQATQPISLGILQAPGPWIVPNNGLQVRLGTIDDEVQQLDEHQTTLLPLNSDGRALRALCGPFYAINHMPLSITYLRPELW